MATLRGKVRMHIALEMATSMLEYDSSRLNTTAREDTLIPTGHSAAMNTTYEIRRMFCIEPKRDIAAHAIKNMTTAENARRTKVVFAMRKTNSLTEPFGFVNVAKSMPKSSMETAAFVSLICLTGLAMMSGS